MLTETFLLYGQPEPPAALVHMRAGPLHVLYDPTSGFLRRIKLGEREVLRGIYAAVRDRNWGTTPGTIRERIREVEARTFRIEFECEHRQNEIHFVWQGKLQGDADGTLRYEFDGVAKASFLRNRIGFCVLHPIQECAGTPARQIRTDGSVVRCRFPELIEPQIFGRSSFRDLRAVAHEITEGLWAELEFEGDTFEMEDQRNWTDASFKTYCTPLALPFPVEVRAGTRIHQVVTLRLSGKSASIEVSSPEPTPLTLEIPTAPTARLPAIGLGVATHGEPLREVEASTLRQLRLSHLRADLRLWERNWQLKLDQAASEAEQLGAQLELAVHLPRQDDFDAEAAARAVRQQEKKLVRVLALREGEPATGPETLQRVRQLLGGLSVPVGAGSDCNFCELNREQALGRLALNDADFLFWSINPQVHATDHLSIMETLEAQAATVRTARAFAQGRPVVVSPVTLKQRFNPVATCAPEPTFSGELPPQVDRRQLSDFAAAWTMGSLASLAAAKVESVTYFETTGWRGLMERASGSPLPELFPSKPGSAFPVLEALTNLAGADQAVILTGPFPPELSVLVLFDGRTLKRIITSNQSPRARAVRMLMPAGVGRLVELRPYQVACLGPIPGFEF